MTAAHLELALPAVPDSIPAIRRAVAGAAVELHADAAVVGAVELAVTEAVTNVVRHAYGSERGDIHVVVEPGRYALVVWVVDDGGGVVEGPHECEGGYGLPLMRSLSRSCELSTTAAGGTSVRMVFSLRGEQERS